MKKIIGIIENKNEISLLNKKRKRKKFQKDSEEEVLEDSIEEKKEIKNYLNFPISEKDIFNKYSEIDQYLIARKICTTTSKNKYNYVCQEIKAENSIQINDAKIIYSDGKAFLFLLSNTNLYIFDIKENLYYDLIMDINLNKDNKFFFSNFPKNIFFIKPKEKIPRKNKQNNSNNIIRKNKKIIKEILYLSILSDKERYLCSFDLKKKLFKNIKNFEKKNLPKKLINNDLKFKLYNQNKILSYNNNCAYMQRIYGSPKFKDFKLNDIESVSLLNKNLFSICTPDIVYIYDSNNENLIGDFRTHGKDKKAKLIKPDNNLLLVKSRYDIALYDLESLMIFQKFELNDISELDEPIRKVKQLTNNNIAILFTTSFAIYNLEKNSITYKYNYLENINDLSNNNIGYLLEISPNFIFVNNDMKNFFIINSIKGDRICSLNINNDNFSLCKRIKKYNFLKGILDTNNNIEENMNDINYILLKNSQSSFILSSIKEDN